MSSQIICLELAQRRLFFGWTTTWQLAKRAGVTSTWLNG